MSKSVFVVAGEVSGDMHLGRLVREVREKDSSVNFWGIGGDACRDAGVELLHHTREMAVMGLAEVLKRYGFFRRVFHEMLAQVQKKKPDAVLLVDYPGFNLRFASKVHGMGGIKVIYYICPQVWAWHRSRIPEMARIVDRLLVIFPFERDVFKNSGLSVHFVGHPLVGAARSALREPLVALPWNGSRRIALLPGSRKQEVERILPAMWKAAGLLKSRYSDTGFMIAAASERIADLSRSIIAETTGGPTNVEIVPDRTREILRQANAAFVASGTATLEAALMKCPMVIVYKTSPATYLAGRLLVKVPHIGMVNLVAGRQVCPEFIQHQANPTALADALEPLAGDTAIRAQMVKNLAEISSKLGESSEAESASELILSDLI